MHKKYLKKYYFISKFDKNHLEKLDKNISIIYRNYKLKSNIRTIINIKKFCIEKKMKFYLSNNFRLAIKLDLDGVYLPSFNKQQSFNCFLLKKKFKILGSAHNIMELNTKIRQKASEVFLCPVFKRKNNNYLGRYGLNNLMKYNKNKTIALGGINNGNIKNLNTLKIFGFAAINLFDKKKAPKK